MKKILILALIGISIESAIMVYGTRASRWAVQEAFKPIDVELAEMNRRVCAVYFDRVKNGRANAGDPSFSDCKE